MRAYCMGNAIILAQVRFIAHGECNSKMYHSESEAIPLQPRAVFNERKGSFGKGKNFKKAW
jgi:hypothetical protein